MKPLRTTQHSQFVKIVNGFPVLDIGACRHLVTIQQETISGTYDASGVADSAWTTRSTVNAAVGMSKRQAQDVIRGGQTVSQLFLEVALFYQQDTGLLPNMRLISDNGSTYTIIAVENVLEHNHVWVLQCLAIGPNE